MKETLEKMFYLGAGAAFMTKEKLEKMKTDLIDQGKITREEGKQFVEELSKKSEAAKTQLEEKIQKTVEAQLQKINVATADDVAELKRQVEELKALIAKDTADE